MPDVLLDQQNRNAKLVDAAVDDLDRLLDDSGDLLLKAHGIIGKADQAVVVCRVPRREPPAGSPSRAAVFRKMSSGAPFRIGLMRLMQHVHLR